MPDLHKQHIPRNGSQVDVVCMVAVLVTPSNK